jgi:hypothetical protein
MRGQVNQPQFAQVHENIIGTAQRGGQL